MSHIDESIVLSISIPTFNRAPFLRKCLESLFILNNCKSLPVEVSVYNNGSVDDTHEVVQEFISNGYPIRYSKQDVAINGNLNIFQCYQKARGKYILCLGDDDVFVANSIEKTVDYLQQNETGVLFLKSANININTYQTLLKTELDIKTVVDPFKFIKAINFMVTFISTSIISNPALDEDAPPEKDYLNFYQVPLILKAIFSGKQNAICKTIILHAEVFNNGEYNLIDVFLTNLNAVVAITPDIKAKEKAFTQKTIKHELLIGYFPFYLYNIRKKKKYLESNNSLSVLHDAYKKNIYYYLFIYPMNKMPFPIATFAKKLNGAFNLVRNKLR